jgi:hypothetical protein
MNQLPASETVREVTNKNRSTNRSTIRITTQATFSKSLKEWRARRESNAGPSA